MRFRPANIRVINRRENYLGRDSRCLPREGRKRRKPLLVVDRSFHIRTIATDYLLADTFDSFQGAFFCNTATKWRPDSGTSMCPPNTISLAVSCRP